MGPNGQAVEPIRREIELGIGRQGVGTLEQPAIPRLDGDAAMAARVAKEGHHPDRRRKGKSDGIEPKPFPCRLLVEDPGGLVRKVRTITGKLYPSAGTPHRLDLPAMYVDLSVTEIWQSTGVVKVQVCQDDMLYGIGLVSQIG
jgi:hypothetical protein